MIKYTALLVVLAFAAGLSGSQPASAQLGQGNGDLRVMTYNVDEGTDYIEVTQATNTTEFLIGVGKTISQVRATKPPERMEALASQIIAASPALVSLQELDQWFTGSLDPTTRTCGSVALEFDRSRNCSAPSPPRGLSTKWWCKDGSSRFRRRQG